MKHHLFIYKRSMLDQNLKDVAQKKKAATPLGVQLNWAWQAQLLSDDLQIMGKFIFS